MAHELRAAVLARRTVHLHGLDVEPLRGLPRERPGGVRRGARVDPGVLQPGGRADGRTRRVRRNLLERPAVDVRRHVVEACRRRAALRRTSTASPAPSPPPTAGCAPPSPRSAPAPATARPRRTRSAPSPPTASPAGRPAPASRPPSSTAAPGGSSAGCCAEPGPSRPPRAAAACARSTCSAPPPAPTAPPGRPSRPPAPSGRTPGPVRTSACSVSHVVHQHTGCRTVAPEDASGATPSRRC